MNVHRQLHRYSDQYHIVKIENFIIIEEIEQIFYEDVSYIRHVLLTECFLTNDFRDRPMLPYNLCKKNQCSNQVQGVESARNPRPLDHNDRPEDKPFGYTFLSELCFARRQTFTDQTPLGTMMAIVADEQGVFGFEQYQVYCSGPRERVDYDL